MPRIGSLRVSRVWPRVPAIARFSPHAAAIAACHGACAAASARAASRPVSRPHSATAGMPTTIPPPIRSRANAARTRRHNPGGRQLLGVNGDSASNATWDGCFGARNSSGAATNCAAIPAGKYPGDSAAAHASPIPTISVGTQRCANRFGAPLSVNRPCAVFAVTIRARLSGVRGPVPASPCLRRRPFAIASPRHRLPARVRALQTGGPPPRTRATPAWKPPRLA